MRRAATSSILFISNDRDTVDSIRQLADAWGWNLLTAASPQEGLRLQVENTFDAILFEPDSSGNGDQASMQPVTLVPGVPVIILARKRSIPEAVSAMRAGAVDYLPAAPLDHGRLRTALHRAVALTAKTFAAVAGKASDGPARYEGGERSALRGLVTADEHVLNLCRFLAAAADARAPLLIEGESGTGKTFLARVLHENSCRRFGPFLEVNCGALSESLLESELFGHERGAFTSACCERAGKFEAANGGTLLLDEIDSASPSLQMRLLRTVESGQFERLGATLTLQTDVRLICTCTVGLELKVADGLFRQDLYHRLNTLKVCLPPLRERVVDIPLLARQLAGQLAETYRRRAPELPPEVMDRLVHYPWPGNIRELRNVLEHGVILSGNGSILLENLPRYVAEYSAAGARRRVGAQPLREALREPERLCILRALQLSGWNKQHAAAELAISRSTLYKKMREHGLDPDSADGRPAGGDISPVRIGLTPSIA